MYDWGIKNYTVAYMATLKKVQEQSNWKGLKAALFRASTKIGQQNKQNMLIEASRPAE